MPRTTRERSEANIYHVINRGVGRQIIFEDDQDRIAFLHELESSLEKTDVSLLCWCLMSNHFHLLLKGDIELISEAMRTCNGRYAKRFNARHDRTGHLFQERFKSEPVSNDAYLVTVVRYIHRNPIAANLTLSCDYAWSSYGWYLRGKGPCPCSTELVLEAFGGLQQFAYLHENACEPEKCLEDTPSRKSTLALPDERAIDIATKTLGAGAIECMKSWEIGRRNDAIVSLSKSGLSIRQIERLSGIGRSTIARAIKCG